MSDQSSHYWKNLLSNIAARHRNQLSDREYRALIEAIDGAGTNNLLRKVALDTASAIGKNTGLGTTLPFKDPDMQKSYLEGQRLHIGHTGPRSQERAVSKYG
jgi:hypothetical protein